MKKIVILLAASALALTATARAAEVTLAATNKFEPEILAFEKKDAANPPLPGGVLFIGSSSIRKWTSLATDFPDVPAINRGFGGSQISDCIYFFDRIVPRYRPRLVVFYAGTNDLAHSGKTPESVAADFRAFCEKLHATLPETKILFISIGYAPKRWDIREKMAFTNALVAAYCAADPRREYVDFNPGMLTPDGQPRPELYVADKLHLNAAGYAVWRRLLAPHLK